MIKQLRTHISKGFGLLVIALLCFSESYWDRANHYLATLMLCSGIFLVAIASAGRLWCSLYIAGYKTDRLITGGPYSMCRNPLYFFSFLGAMGVGLATETLIIPALILTAFWAYYPLVIREEEKDLAAVHTGSFSAYRHRVPRFIPNPSLLEEPEEYLVKPRIFKKHLFDVLWFAWILGVLELIEEAHRAGILPAVFRLY